MGEELQLKGWSNCRCTCAAGRKENILLSDSPTVSLRFIYALSGETAIHARPSGEMKGEHRHDKSRTPPKRPAGPLETSVSFPEEVWKNCPEKHFVLRASWRYCVFIHLTSACEAAFFRLTWCGRLPFLPFFNHPECQHLPTGPPNSPSGRFRPTADDRSSA